MGGKDGLDGGQVSLLELAILTWPQGTKAIRGYFEISPKSAAALTISAAAGAAAVPPYTPFSISTDIAILRVLAAAALCGANPMNQACEGASASSAVPVLPAIGIAPAARRPVPEVTTSRMKRARVCAVSRETTGWGASVRVLLSSVIQRPSGIAPPFAMVAATRAI